MAFVQPTQSRSLSIGGAATLQWLTEVFRLVQVARSERRVGANPVSQKRGRPGVAWSPQLHQPRRGIIGDGEVHGIEPPFLVSRIPGQAST